MTARSFFLSKLTRKRKLLARDTHLQQVIYTLYIKNTYKELSFLSGQFQLNNHIYIVHCGRHDTVLHHEIHNKNKVEGLKNQLP